MGQFPQLLNGALHVVGHLAEQLGGDVGIIGGHVPRQPQVHRQRDQVLLGSVVQVALHPAALGVTARHDPRP